MKFPALAMDTTNQRPSNIPRGMFLNQQRSTTGRDVRRGLNFETLEVAVRTSPRSSRLDSQTRPARCAVATVERNAAVPAT
jgi:hypothetical protein